MGFSLSLYFHFLLSSNSDQDFARANIRTIGGDWGTLKGLIGRDEGPLGRPLGGMGGHFGGTWYAPGGVTCRQLEVHLGRHLVAPGGNLRRHLEGKFYGILVTLKTGYQTCHQYSHKVSNGPARVE